MPHRHVNKGDDRPEVITIPTLGFEDNLDVELRHALYRFTMGAEVSDGCIWSSHIL